MKCNACGGDITTKIGNMEIRWNHPLGPSHGLDERYPVELIRLSDKCDGRPRCYVLAYLNVDHVDFVGERALSDDINWDDVKRLLLTGFVMLKEKEEEDD